MNLPSPKTTRNRRRVGRGMASGKGGHTTGKGMKGQKSRSGYSSPRPGFEGGRMPLSRRIPKLRGFRRAYQNSRIKNIVLNVSDLETYFEDGDTVDRESLAALGYKPSSTKETQIKILGNGDLKKKLTVRGVETSASAKAKVEAVGGKVE